MSWFAVGAAAVSVGTGIYTSQQSKKAANKALDQQRSIAANLKYEPIDIEKLKADATAAAIENATTSLAVERKLSPDIATARAELSRRVSENLQQGGKLPADVQNTVTMAGRTIGGRSGIGSGGTTPLTASLLGISSLDLLNQRQRDAERLLAANPAPVTGIDPGTLAGIQVAENAAMNQFNADKAGVDRNISNLELDARAAQIGGQAGIASGIGALAKGIGTAYMDARGGVGEPISYDAYIKKYGAPRQPEKPAFTPVDTNFTVPTTFDYRYIR